MSCSNVRHSNICFTLITVRVPAHTASHQTPWLSIQYNNVRFIIILLSLRNAFKCFIAFEAQENFCRFVVEAVLFLAY